MISILNIFLQSKRSFYENSTHRCKDVYIYQETIFNNVPEKTNKNLEQTQIKDQVFLTFLRKSIYLLQKGVIQSDVNKFFFRKRQEMRIHSLIQFERCEGSPFSFIPKALSELESLEGSSNNWNSVQKHQLIKNKEPVSNIFVIFPPDYKKKSSDSDQSNRQKFLRDKEIALNIDDKQFRLIRRRIDKEIKFDLFYYCLLEQCENKKQTEKKRREITKQKNHRSLISLFVLFKLVVKEKKGSLDLNELREKVEKRIQNKYDYCFKNYRDLLKGELSIIFQAFQLFLTHHEMEAVQKVYQSRQKNRNIMSKMERCKEILQDKKYE